MDNKEAQLALSKAKVALMTYPDSVFFCEIAFSFKYVWDETIPTAAVDGVSVFLNPSFFMGLKPEKRVGLILHEVMHPVYMHLCRRGTRDHQRWNEAGDHVINLMLLDRKFELPDCGLFDPQYKGMNTDQVYKLLPERDRVKYDCDIMESPVEPEELQKQIEDIVVRASIRSQQENDKPGTVPGDIQLFLDSLLKPKLPWQSILRKYFNTFTKSDYTFKKPNRRYFPDYYLPSMTGTTLDDLAIAVDISGSVSDEEFKYFVSEITAILRMGKPKKITLIQFDTAIRHTDEIQSIQDLMRVTFTGRGGTYIPPVIDWANKNKPKVMLVFTDGEFRFHTQETKIPFIWMIHGTRKFNPPFGKTIQYLIPV